MTVSAPERRELPDGSVVDLKPGAEIAVEFTPALRRVTLRAGAAHFAVVKNPARPFVVAVGDVEMRAVGTEYSVQARANAMKRPVPAPVPATQRPKGGAPLDEFPPSAQSSREKFSG